MFHYDKTSFKKILIQFVISNFQYTRSYVEKILWLCPEVFSAFNYCNTVTAALRCSRNSSFIFEGTHRLEENDHNCIIIAGNMMIKKMHLVFRLRPGYTSARIALHLHPQIHVNKTDT